MGNITSCCLIWSILLLSGDFGGANGDDGKDLFSSTDDMKKLFAKEQLISGSNDKISVKYV